MSDHGASWAREGARDQAESAFTEILRRLLHRMKGILAVAFVDGAGECVDYCSALDPFDTKVVAAQLLRGLPPLLPSTLSAAERGGAGPTLRGRARRGSPLADLCTHPSGPAVNLQ